MRNMDTERHFTVISDRAAFIAALNFDLMSEPGIRKWHSFMEEATDSVTSYGGSISGEHGDGQSKAEFLYKMFGPRLDRSLSRIQIHMGPDWKDESGKDHRSLSN